jgi:hypothetical protein
MNPWKIHSDSLRDLQNEQGDDCPLIYYSDKIIKTLPGSDYFKSTNSQGGNMLDSDLKIVCLCSDFGDNFDFDAFNQQTFRYKTEDGQLYRVKDTKVSPTGFQVLISADNAAEGL